MRTSGSSRRRSRADRWRRGLAALALTVVTAGSSAACGSPRDASDSLLERDRVVIGVKPDQPGLGLRTGPDRFEGFDVDVARELAHRLGFTDDDLRFVATPSSVRERALVEHEVDLIVASYSITPQRKTVVGFAGPYYVAHQDTLVRADDTSIQDVRDLAGRRLCAVAGSNSWRRVTEEREIPAVPVPAASYSECLTKLKRRDVDAVSTDDLILAGFAASAGEDVRILNAPFTDERYGVGIAREDVDACEELNRAISAMYVDGTAQRLLRKWFGGTTLDLTMSVPEFEGCG